MRTRSTKAPTRALIGSSSPVRRKKLKQSSTNGLMIIALVCFVLAMFGIVALMPSETHEMTTLESSSMNETKISQVRLRGPRETTTASVSTKAARSAWAMSTLVLITEHGSIRIKLKPEFGSPESVEYIRRAVAAPTCPRCNLYRAERPGILQGVLRAPPEILLPTQRGACPLGFENVPNDCPKWDPECACHGPVMKHGYVGWAAGKTGPDFFIDSYLRPAQWWGTQHTVWGQITDEASFSVITSIYELPVVNRGGLHHLEHPVHFDMHFE